MTLNEICNEHILPVTVAQTSETATLNEPFELLKRVPGGYKIIYRGVSGFVSKSPVNDYEVCND